MRKLSPETSEQITSTKAEISLYRGTLTTANIITQVKRLKAAFPLLKKEFYDVLAQRVKSKGFTDKQLKDAVDHVIDTCHYSHPALADILSFDERVKLYTYPEVIERVNEGEEMKEFKKIKDRKLWIRAHEVEKHNLQHLLQWE